MNCSGCGTDNREGARFCRVCGRELATDEGPLPLDGGKIGEIDSQQKASAGELPEEVAAEEGLDETEIEARTSDVQAESEVKAEPGQPPRTTISAMEMIGDEAAEAQSVLEPAGEVPAGTAEQRGEPEGESMELEVSNVGEAAELELSLDSDGGILAFWRDEVELMTPVEPGAVIGGRFAVIEALDVQEDQILYLAHDLQRCWQCGYEENDSAATFCARCSVLMDRREEVRLLEARDAEAEPAADKIVVGRLEHDSRHFLLLAEPETEAEPMPEGSRQPASIRLLVGQRSHAGQVRELDEDSLFVLTLSPTYESRTGPVMGLFVVADGMGGHAGGEVASRMALQVLVDRVMRTIIIPEIARELVLEDEIIALLRQATIAANDAVYLDRQKRETDMGSTMTTALVRDNRLFLAHVGDSRAYRWNADGLEQLTTDHSVIASMIAEGQAEPEELYTHPHRSIIYRCIGDKPLVDVDTDMFPLTPGDRIVLCCDGLWEMIRDEGISDVMMQEAEPQAACDMLVRRANAAGGDDNISVIVVLVEGVEEAED